MKIQGTKIAHRASGNKWRVEGKRVKGREERSAVFHFVHCRGTQFRSLLWVLFLSVADSFAPRCIRAATDSRSDVRAPIRYCVPLAMQQAAQYTAWQRVPPEPVFIYCRGTIDGSLFLLSPPREAQSRSRAITSARSKSGADFTLSLSLFLFLPLFLSFCRSYKSSIGFDPRHSRFSLAGPIFENDLSPRIGGCASWWWTVYGPIVTRRVPLSGGVIVVSIRITE